MADTNVRWRPPRTCEEYWSELRHCRSLSNRFHQLYAHGTAPHCQQWRDDYYACRQWEKSLSAEAKQSERARLAGQRKFAPVWELRQSPPADWHLPLPQDAPQDS
ncbi:UPF0545 protein C22orf39 homolog isoform X2 [Conger conger]|uniref:UPF0545 protein C22orf39 homolog isoform X2 n=1 Tax=Conger conger TaxID=82655 RepID=UPI002A59A27A|nr:UPF0545 protein C22orf39 homolog isoform X2 [Conger conger]